MVSFAYPDHLPTVADVCSTFVLDNGAFTAWKKGGAVDYDAYLEWVDEWRWHPAFDWAIIPDVIDGTEQDNDRMLARWPSDFKGVPVWHMHESPERLRRLSGFYPLVALGSSGQWPTPGTESWWDRMDEVMPYIVDEHGRPMCKLHGLRMLDPEIFTRLPFASADSTNAAVNSGSVSRFGMYTPPEPYQRAQVIADRIEYHSSAPVWKPRDKTELTLFAEGRTA